MLVVNFARPFTADHLQQLTTLLGTEPNVRMIGSDIDRADLLPELAVRLVDAVGLSPAEWQTTMLVVNPPGLAVLALIVIAEIAGRAGYLPTVINMRPVAGADLPHYEIASLVPLQLQRDAARRRLAESAP